MSDAKIDDMQLKAVVNRLMDKAGTDPRLTPRLLREKAETKMKLPEGALKHKRPRIKIFIVDWWSKNVAPVPSAPKVSKRASADDDDDAAPAVDPDLTLLRNIAKYAKAVGKGNSFFKDLPNTTHKEKAKVLRKRLLAVGINVPDAPTAADIEAAKKSHELKKEASDVDPTLIVSHSRRDAAAAAAAAPPVKVEKKPKVTAHDEEEEAQF